MSQWNAYRDEARAMVILAWPIIIAQLAQMGTGVVDTIMAGRYGAMDLAAIAIGYNIWLPLFLLTLGIMLATSVLVAQDFGAGRLQNIRDTLPQALWLALLLGLIVGPACYNAQPLLNLLELDASTQQKSLDYLQAVAWGLPATVLFQALRCHTQGIGILRPFAIASVLGFIANIPLNYALIYGKWGFPEMGAAGCGWATAISMWLGAVLIGGYIVLEKSIHTYLPPLRLVKPDFNRIREIAMLGTPIGLSFFLEIGVLSLLALMIATMGNSAIAAHQIAYNVWDVIYMPLISMGSAMATRVGHAIGSGNETQVRLAVNTGIVLTLLVGLACTLLLLPMPGLLISDYTSDPEIHQIAVRLIHLAALFILIDSLQVGVSYCLRAFKDTSYPFVIMCLSYWGLSLPLAWWLGFKVADNPADGTAGIWTSLVAGICLCAVLVTWRLLRTLRRPLPELTASAQDESNQGNPLGG
jgi:MATE family multidrug resistance protein